MQGDGLAAGEGAAVSCPHHTQYAAPGVPLKCADWRTCDESPAGEFYKVPAWGRDGRIVTALFSRELHDGVYVWRQETPWG